MLPIKDLRLSVGELLAADVAFLAAVLANKIALVTNAFTPNENLALVDFTLASFTGSTPKAAVAGTQQAGIDPNTGAQTITILAPAGGWRWECTVAPGSPQVITGYILTDNAGAVLLGMTLLSETVTISGIGDFIDLGKVEMQIVTRPLS